jgi:hypothetical protein
MPRATFGLDALTGATPGLSKLAQAFAGGNGAYQQGYEGEVSSRSKIAQAMAAAAASQAKADQDNTETNIVRSRPDLIDENVALEAGTTLPLVRAFQQYTRTGVMPTRQLQGPADEAGNGPGVAPVLDDTGLQSKIAQAMRRSLPMRTNVKDTNVEDFAKAAGLYQGQDLTNDVLNGARTPGQVGAAQAAAGGKPLYHFDSSGLVGDLFGGGLNESSGRARAVTGEHVARGNQATAGAAENYAQAAAATARAKALAQDGSNGGKAPSGYAWGPMDEDGQRTLLPIAGGPRDPANKLKDIPATVNAKIIEGSQGLDNIDKAIAAVEANPGAFGMVNAIPFVERARQGDSGGVDARAQVANIGSLKLHDRSGAAVSASEFPRLAPFIPSSSDSPKAIVTKLKKMKEIAEGELGLFTDTYSEEGGYKPSPILSKRVAAAAAKGAKPAQAAPPAAAGGFTYLGKEP